jgi:electron transfer flavoprotein beta subunit
MEQQVRILVCIKQVPDTQKVRIDPERGTLIRKGVPSITNPLDETALELALEIRDIMPAVITVLTMGIPDSECILRDALSLGADEAFLLTGSQFAGADTLATSYALSRAIKSIGTFDLLLFGKQAIDGDTAQVGPEVSGQLGLPLITFVQSIQEIDENRIVVERMIDNGKQTVSADYPVLLSVTKAKQRLRMPDLAAVIKSFDIPVRRIGADDIDADVEKCGLKGSPTRVKKIFSPKVHSDVEFLGESVEDSATAAAVLLKDKGFY